MNERLSTWERMVGLIGIGTLVAGIFWLGNMSAKLDLLTKNVEKLTTEMSNLPEKIGAMSSDINWLKEAIKKLEEKQERSTAILQTQSEAALAAITPPGVETITGIIRSVDIAQRKIVLSDAEGNDVEFSVPEERQFAFSESDVGRVYLVSSTRDVVGTRIVRTASISPQEFTKFTIGIKLRPEPE